MTKPLSPDLCRTIAWPRRSRTRLIERAILTSSPLPAPHPECGLKTRFHSALLIARQRIVACPPVLGAALAPRTSTVSRMSAKARTTSLGVRAQ